MHRGLRTKAGGIYHDAPLVKHRTAAIDVKISAEGNINNGENARSFPIVIVFKTTCRNMLMQLVQRYLSL
jgi:hypothetical protein